MATFKLNQTGAAVQADLDKVEGMANIKTIGSGLSLSNAGQLSASGGSLPAGGTAGQVLTKVDGTDYNTEWQTPQGGGGSGLQGYNLTYRNETDPLQVGFLKMNSNNKLIYVGYPGGSVTVTHTNVIAIINKKYYVQSTSTSTGSIYDLEAKEYYDFSFVRPVESQDGHIWILTGDVNYNDTD